MVCNHCICVFYRPAELWVGLGKEKPQADHRWAFASFDSGGTKVIIEWQDADWIPWSDSTSQSGSYGFLNGNDQIMAEKDSLLRAFMCETANG